MLFRKIVTLLNEENPLCRQSVEFLEIKIGANYYFVMLAAVTRLFVHLSLQYEKENLVHISCIVRVIMELI
jgi:hypothetical protein